MGILLAMQSCGCMTTWYMYSHYTPDAVLYSALAGGGPARALGGKKGLSANVLSKVGCTSERVGKVEHRCLVSSQDS